MRGIVAVSEDGYIGKDGELPWHHSEDLQYFRNVTKGTPVVMGRSTHESIGKLLPGRMNIVLGSETSGIPGTITCTTPDIVRQLLREMGQFDTAWVIGGLQTYETFWYDIDFWSITRIPEKVQGDTSFPESRLAERFSLARRDSLGSGIGIEMWTSSNS